MSYLDNINSPADVKKLNLKELEALAEEIRSAILNRDSKIGGHVGPNLGIVETTIALHYVFNSPEDKIVYDVSHQSYPHKILTGRKNGFLTDEGMRKISGYTTPAESEHDHFIVGHTSTSVSLACGLAKARDLKGEKHNVIAVIGDGSLSGGEALEGFDNAAVLNSNIIIIVNDNEMSIAENHGGLYGNLRLLRQTGGKAECNMFKALGFDYRYLEEGNDIAKLTSLMKEVKDTDKPTVLHIHTEKGKGYKPAEEHKETWHWSVPFDIASGNPTVDLSGENYNSITVNYLQEKIAKDKKVVLINAGTPVYYAHPSGRILSLLDRLFYAGSEAFMNKPGAAVVSARRAGTTASLDVLNKYFTISRMPVVSSRYWNMVHGQTPEDVMQDAEGLQVMELLGRNMAWLLKCIAAGKQAGILPPQLDNPVMTNFIRR